MDRKSSFSGKSPGPPQAFSGSKSWEGGGGRERAEGATAHHKNGIQAKAFSRPFRAPGFHLRPLSGSLPTPPTQGSQGLPKPQHRFSSSTNLLSQSISAFPPTAPNLMTSHSLPGPSDSSVDSKETKGLEPDPNPNLAPASKPVSFLQALTTSNLEKTRRLRARPSAAPVWPRPVHLLRIGGIRPGLHLKKSRGFEPD